MGKGQRLRAARAIEKEANRAEMEKKAKKNRAIKIICSVVAIVLVLCITGGLIYNAVYSAAYSQGDIQRKAPVYETSHQKVDAAMMSYFFYTQYNTFVNTYQSSLSSFKLDTSKSLKRQDCILSTGNSWYDYFMTQTKTQVEELVVLAEKAVADNLSLDDDDKKSIDDSVQTYADYAKENNLSTNDVFERIFGTGVKEQDVRKCLELSMLGQKYYDKYQDSLEYADAEIDTYYQDNIDTYRMVDYYSYTVSAANTEDSSTYAAAKAKADTLAACKNEDAFKKGVEAILREEAAGSDKTEEEIQSDVTSAVESCLIEGAKRNAESDYSKWLFDSAKAGETKVFDDEKGNYTVYLLVKEPYRDEADTKTIRSIVLLYSTYGNLEETEKKADEIFSKMKEAGLTEETFKEYAATYSENTGTAQNGGLMDSYAKDDYDRAVADWAFDSARKEGDFEIVKMEDGISICYYVGNGMKAWKSKCVTDMKTKDYQDSMEKWKEEVNLKTYENNFNKVPDIA